MGSPSRSARMLGLSILGAIALYAGVLLAVLVHR
jgi:hypothetical protein